MCVARLAPPLPPLYLISPFSYLPFPLPTEPHFAPCFSPTLLSSLSSLIFSLSNLPFIPLSLFLPSWPSLHPPCCSPLTAPPLPSFSLPTELPFIPPLLLPFLSPKSLSLPPFLPSLCPLCYSPLPCSSLPLFPLLSSLSFPLYSSLPPLFFPVISSLPVCSPSFPSPALPHILSAARGSSILIWENLHTYSFIVPSVPISYIICLEKSVAAFVLFRNYFVSLVVIYQFMFRVEVACMTHQLAS